jgi:uncharacterized protein GlcG (DUF336 family)
MTGLLSHHAIHAALAAAADHAATSGAECTLAVCDAGGHLLGLLRTQGALLASLESAQTKARTAVYFGVETRHLPSVQPIVPALLGAVSYPLALLPGGIPVRVGSQITAGVGVGGGSGDQDQAIAEYLARSLSSRLQPV